MPASSPPAQRSNGKPAPLSRESEKTEWRGVVYACAATALSDLTFGMIAPFFPNAALSRGVSQSVVGAIFAVQALGARGRQQQKQHNFWHVSGSWSNLLEIVPKGTGRCFVPTCLDPANILAMVDLDF